MGEHGPVRKCSARAPFVLQARRDDSPGVLATDTQAPVTLADLEAQAIRAAVDAVAGNRRKAAERLGIGLRTLYDKLKRYDIAD